MIVPPKNELQKLSRFRMQIFNEPTYAWELLQWEIAIEMNEALSGQAIARLLELYMRGVQKMNSLMDIREAYFRNKVTSLMMKTNVVKTLNKPPMSKKEKPLEVSAKVEVKPVVKSSKEAVVQKKAEKSSNVQQIKKPANAFTLQQKRRQIEMRLAYQAEASSRQNLNNMYNQHIRKEENFNNKVKGYLNDHQQRLKERITRRKLKTATYRSRPEDTSDTFPIDQNGHIKKENEDGFTVPIGGGKSKQNINRIKRCLSLNNKIDHDLTLVDSPKKSRKNTFDYSEVKQNLDNPILLKKIQQPKTSQFNEG